MRNDKPRMGTADETPKSLESLVLLTRDEFSVNEATRTDASVSEPVLILPIEDVQGVRHEHVRGTKITRTEARVSSGTTTEVSNAHFVTAEPKKKSIATIRRETIQSLGKDLWRYFDALDRGAEFILKDVLWTATKFVATEFVWPLTKLIGRTALTIPVLGDALRYVGNQSHNLSVWWASQSVWVRWPVAGTFLIITIPLAGLIPGISSIPFWYVGLSMGFGEFITWKDIMELWGILKSDNATALAVWFMKKSEKKSSTKTSERPAMLATI